VSVPPDGGRDGNGARFHIPSDTWAAQRESAATIGAFLSALRFAAWAECTRRACPHPQGDVCWVLPGKVPPWPSSYGGTEEEIARRELWFGVVAERLGEEDARAHVALPADADREPMLVVRGEKPLSFGGYSGPVPDRGRGAMTVGTVDARGGLVVTCRGEVWHLLAPVHAGLVLMGHNLVAYASSLDRAGILAPAVVEKLCGHYRLGVASAMARQATSRCP